MRNLPKKDINNLAVSAQQVLFNLRSFANMTDGGIEAYWDIKYDEPHDDLKELNSELARYNMALELYRPVDLDQYLEEKYK